MKLPRIPPSDEEVKRILAEPANQEIMKELGKNLSRINASYYHWDEIRLRYRPNEAEILWAYTSFFRQTNARYINLKDMVLRYVQTLKIEEMLHNTDMAIGSKIDYLLDDQLPSPELKKKYLVSSLMEEAISSSQLEGAATTRKVAKKMLRENRKPRNKDEQMIWNNYAIMKYLKEVIQAKTPLTLELIKEIQKIITTDTLEEKQYVGNFRTDNDVVVKDKETGALLHDPPDYKNIEPLLQNVCAFINAEPTEYYLHPIVKAIFLHFMIGYVHPFYDGNGRTARALFYWYALSKGYTYLEYISVSSAIKNAPIQYTTAYLYAESDHNDLTYFVKFNLDKIRIAAEAFNKYIERKKEENKRLVQTLKYNQKLNYRQADILISLCRSEKTSISIEEMQERYNTTYQTARMDLLNLVEMGYMHQITIGRRFLFSPDKEKCIGMTQL